MSNQEEVELRSKIEALGLEASKVPERAPQNISEVNANTVIIPNCSLYNEFVCILIKSFLEHYLARNSCRAGQTISKA
jgi:hypothetical protein